MSYMNGRSFVDTNILVYAQDQTAGTKHEIALNVTERLWNSNLGVLSTQVLQEFCVIVTRKIARPMSFAQLRRILDDYLSWEVVINAPAATLGALQLQERYQISFWDALLIHAAKTAEVEILYSEDLSHGQRYGSVRVVNPFLQ